MKKILVIALAVAMVLSQGVCAFAADKSDKTDTIKSVTSVSNGTIDVNVTDSSRTDTVYYVTVEWKNTGMAYEVTGNNKWNPVNHAYTDEELELNWNDKEANVIVTNHSNAGVTATIASVDGNKLSYKFDTQHQENTNTFDLATAVNTEVGEAPANTFTITAVSDPDPILKENFTENFTVTIIAQEQAAPEVSYDIDLSKLTPYQKISYSVSEEDDPLSIYIPETWTISYAGYLDFSFDENGIPLGEVADKLSPGGCEIPWPDGKTVSDANKLQLTILVYDDEGSEQSYIIFFELAE